MEIEVSLTQKVVVLQQQEDKIWLIQVVKKSTTVVENVGIIMQVSHGKNQTIIQVNKGNNHGKETRDNSGSNLGKIILDSLGTKFKINPNNKLRKSMKKLSYVKFVIYRNIQPLNVDVGMTTHILLRKFHKP